MLYTHPSLTEMTNQRGETYRWDPKAKLNVELLKNGKVCSNQYSLDVQMVRDFDFMMQLCCLSGEFANTFFLIP